MMYALCPWCLEDVPTNTGLTAQPVNCGFESQALGAVEQLQHIATLSDVLSTLPFLQVSGAPLYAYEQATSAVHSLFTSATLLCTHLLKYCSPGLLGAHAYVTPGTSSVGLRERGACAG